MEEGRSDGGGRLRASGVCCAASAFGMLVASEGLAAGAGRLCQPAGRGQRACKLPSVNTPCPATPAGTKGSGDGRASLAKI